MTRQFGARIQGHQGLMRERGATAQIDLSFVPLRVLHDVWLRPGNGLSQSRKLAVLVSKMSVLCDTFAPTGHFPCPGVKRSDHDDSQRPPPHRPPRPPHLQRTRRNDTGEGTMMLLFAAWFLFLVLLLKLVVHPLQGILALVRTLTAVFGLIFLLTVIGQFWNHDYLAAAGWILPTMFLFWCTNKLSHQEA
jgi:hypothetical protein